MRLLPPSPGAMIAVNTRPPMIMAARTPSLATRNSLILWSLFSSSPSSSLRSWARRASLSTMYSFLTLPDPDLLSVPVWYSTRWISLPSATVQATVPSSDHDGRVSVRPRTMGCAAPSASSRLFRVSASVSITCPMRKTLLPLPDWARPSSSSPMLSRSTTAARPPFGVIPAERILPSRPNGPRSPVAPEAEIVSRLPSAMA